MTGDKPVLIVFGNCQAEIAHACVKSLAAVSSRYQVEYVRSFVHPTEGRQVVPADQVRTLRDPLGAVRFLGWIPRPGTACRDCADEAVHLAGLSCLVAAVLRGPAEPVHQRQPIRVLFLRRQSRRTACRAGVVRQTAPLPSTMISRPRKSATSIACLRSRQRGCTRFDAANDIALGQYVLRPFPAGTPFLDVQSSHCEAARDLVPHADRCD